MEEYDDRQSKMITNSTSDDGKSVDQELKRIEAFDLVTEGLQLLDRYKEREDSHLLDEALSCFTNAVKVDPEYFKAKYFLAVTKYVSMSSKFGSEVAEVSRELLASENEGSEFADWSPWKQFQELGRDVHRESNPSAYAEVSYNLATIYYEMSRDQGSIEIQSEEPQDQKVNTTWPDYLAFSAIQRFTFARLFTQEPALKLLGRTGELAVRARRMNKEDREMVNQLRAKIKAELRGNLWRRIIGLKSADLQVTAKVREILKRIPTMSKTHSNDTPKAVDSAT